MGAEPESDVGVVRAVRQQRAMIWEKPSGKNSAGFMDHADQRRRCTVGTLQGGGLDMNKPDHYSVLTVVLSFSLGALSSLNAVAESYLPLISAVSIITSMSLTVWYYRTKINELKKSSKHKGTSDG